MVAKHNLGTNCRRKLYRKVYSLASIRDNLFEMSPKGGKSEYKF